MSENTLYLLVSEFDILTVSYRPRFIAVTGKMKGSHWIKFALTSVRLTRILNECQNSRRKFMAGFQCACCLVKVFGERFVFVALEKSLCPL